MEWPYCWGLIPGPGLPGMESLRKSAPNVNTWHRVVSEFRMGRYQKG